MTKQIRVLIIEDNEDDAILEISELKNGGYNIYYQRIQTCEEMNKALQNDTWDCIISDYSMPNFSGLKALAELKKTEMDIPFILISGTIGEETAVAAMKAGANDYIMKNNLSRLIPAFERELREAEVRQLKKQAEETILYERKLLRTLIDNLPDNVYVKNNECRKIIANKADVKFMGFMSEHDIIGKTDLEIYEGETGICGYNDDKLILQSGEPVINREGEFIDSRGEHHWLLTSKLPILNEKGIITGIVGVEHNMTQRKQMEIELKKTDQILKEQNQEYLALNEEYLALNEELLESLDQIQRINADLVIAKNHAEESDKLKSAFLANMSHEIRTPLNAIMGFSQFLKEKSLSHEKTEYFVKIIESSGHQLLTIINDILDISKIEAGQINIVSEVVNITNLFYEIYLQYSEQVELKKLKLLLFPDKQNEPIITKTDENRLRQVLCNLLNNAIKFTSEGSIEFGYKLDDNIISIHVKDSGIGISPENHSIIFKPFRQVENSITQNYGGNGLGLSISKALVEKMGGTISLTSEPGQGSTFVFTVPYTQGDEIKQRPEKVTRSKRSSNWNKHIILIAEDEKYNFHYLEQILSSTHVQLLHAWNGKEAIDFVNKHPNISLVLMDIKLPFVDGYTATRIIKKLRPQLPVIAQTAYALSGDKENILKSGFDNYLSKPVSRDSLMEIVGSYIDE